MLKRRLSLLLMLCVLLMALCGCSAENKEQNTVSLQIAVATTYVPETTITGLETELKEQLPALYADGKNVIINGISTGDSEKNPEMTMAGMARLMGMMASGEIELLICDPENAQRYAESGESFVPVSELFSDEELTSLGLKTVSVPVRDDDGNATGEMSAPCGFDLSACTLMTETLYQDNMAAYVFVNTASLENAKAVIKLLASNQ